MKCIHSFILLLTILLIGAHNIVQAQPKSTRFGKIEEEIIRQETFEAYPDAPAIVLYDQGDRYYEVRGDLRLTYQRHTRIKILSEEAFYLAQVEVPFVSEDNLESVAEIKAITHYVDENGDIVEQKMDKKTSVFEEDYDGYSSVKKFILPNVKVGCVVEYTYKIITEDFFFPRNWNFQRVDVPTLYSEVTMGAPDGFNYAPKIMGEVVNLQQKVENFNRTDFKGRLFRYWATNIPALKSEAYAPNLNNFVFRAIFELTSITIPGVAYEDFSRTWGQIGKGLFEGSSYKSTVSPPKKVRVLAEQLQLTQVESPEEAVIKVLSYLRTNMNWNEYYGIYSSPPISNLLQDKTGNGASINLLGVALLREAGIDANPVLISIRRRGMVQRFFPSRRQFNHVLIGVQAGENFMIFDGVSKMGSMDMIPVQDLNGSGMMVSPEQVEWVQVNPIHKRKKDVTLIAKLGADGTIEGTLTFKDKGYQALFSRYDYFKQANEDLSTFFSNRMLEGLSETELSEYTIKNQDTLAKPLISTCLLNSQDFIQMGGDFMYLKPMTFAAQEENPFQSENRK